MSQQPEISQQAHRFPETRFAFPPFVIRFNQEVDESTMINVLENHFSSTYAFNLELAAHRLRGEGELLLFVNNRESFEIFFDDLKWPPSIGLLNYEKIGPTHLPPQFSIVLRNVPLNIETDDLLNTIEEEHLDALTIHRILNKDKRPASFVRVDIQSVKTIDEILKKRFIYVTNIRLAVSEYLAPAKVHCKKKGA